MQELNISSITIKKHRPKTSSKNQQTTCLNCLNQDFSTTKINKKWVTDITYIHTLSDVWCYLSCILDLYSRKVIAWKLSRTMETELVLDTVRMALSTRKVKPGLILHSDRGSQYTTQAYQELLDEYGIQSSYSAKGYPYDNSCIEAFHASLKKECIYVEAKQGYKDSGSCYQSLFRYIEGFYNQHRRHSSIQFTTTNDYDVQSAS